MEAGSPGLHQAAVLQSREMCPELPDRGEDRGDAGRDRPEEAGGAGAPQEPESREISHRQLQACALARLQG